MQADIRARSRRPPRRTGYAFVAPHAPSAPRPTGRSGRAAGVADARARLTIADIYHAHLPWAYADFADLCAASPPVVSLYGRLIADVRAADLFPVPDPAGLATDTADEDHRRAIDHVVGAVIGPGMPPPGHTAPEWTRTIPTDGAGVRYRYAPATAPDGEALLLLLAAPTYNEQPLRGPLHAPLDPRIHCDAPGRRCLLQRFTAIMDYAEAREPCHWAYDADRLEAHLCGTGGPLARLPPPLDGLADAARMMNRSTGEPYLDDDGVGDDVFDGLPWDVASVGELADLWARARPYHARVQAALAALRDPATFAPFVDALYRAVRAASSVDPLAAPPPAPLWRTLGLTTFADEGDAP